MKTAPIVLITGASAGIGRRTAMRLAELGCQVFGTSRHPEQVEPIPGVTLLPLDVQSPDSIETCVQSVLAQAGCMDILINNAGVIGPAAATEEADIQRVRSLFETNFFGVVQVTNAVLPVMRKQRSGTILNISSAGGLISLPPFFTFYAASKHALEGYTEGLRHELRPLNIRVAMVEPGYTRTAISDTIQPPDHPIPDYAENRRRVTRLDQACLEYGSDPDTVARVICHVIQQEHPALRNPAGSDSLSMVIASRILPEPLFERLVDWMFLSWSSPENSQEIPTPQELGLHRFLFHTPTRDRLQQTAFALLGGLGLGLGLLLLKRRTRK